MKIELKNVKFSEHLSEETNAFTADIYINGVKAGYAKNSGHGGCTDCRAHFEHKDLFAKAEKHLLTLPPKKLPGYTFELESNMENLVDELFENWLKAKDNKKLEKKMESNFLVRRADGNIALSGWKNRTLAQMPLPALQMTYDNIKKQLKTGETIINTNLEKLGVKL
jgi:hypothetical protein